VPTRPLEVARHAGQPAVVVMMLPWTAQPGSLETLCLPSIYARWPQHRHCLDEYCRCTETDTWGNIREAKMRLRAMISSICRSDPNTGLQFAWSRPEELIPLNHNCFDQVVGFLGGFRRLLANG
jgi:hypothetical protein